MRKKLRKKKVAIVARILGGNPEARLSDLAKAVYGKVGPVTKKRAQRLRDFYLMKKLGTP